MNLTTKRVIYLICILILFAFLINSLKNTKNENAKDPQNRPETGEISF